MGMVALEQRIASAYVILFGVHGEITRQAPKCIWRAALEAGFLFFE